MQLISSVKHADHSRSQKRMKGKWADGWTGGRRQLGLSRAGDFQTPFWTSLTLYWETTGHVALWPSLPFDKNTSSGRLRIKYKAKAHFRLSLGPVGGTHWETELGQYLVFSCLQTLQRLVVISQQILQSLSIAVLCSGVGGEEEEVGGARHDGADPKRMQVEMGVWEAPEHARTSHKDGKRRKHRYC